VYATIHRYATSAGSTDELAEVGWQLGSALARSPGFVATVAVEDGSGALITISLFEDLVSLAGAAPLAERWTAEHRARLILPAIEMATGEVVAQTGL
jgi:hypothetical protein